MQSPDVAFFTLFNTHTHTHTHIYIYGFCYRRKIERKIRTIDDTISRAFRVPQQYKLAMKDFKGNKFFPVNRYVFTDASFVPWTVTNQPEINLVIKSFEPVSA